MGGPGSGNHDHWWRPARKTVVEDCLDLDLVQLARKGVLVPGSAGTVRWYADEEETDSVRYRTARSVSGGLTLTVTYWTEGEDVVLPIRIETTLLHRGGRRHWGICPLVVAGRVCERRVGKLYLPPDARYFGCRGCYDLSYTSCQESHQLDSVCKNLARDTGFDLNFVKKGLQGLGKRDEAL